MSKSAQQRAIENYRARLAKRGISRFEVTGLDTDRELLRTLARKLADDPEADRIRADVSHALVREEPVKGRILSALRRSPLVGAEVEFKREKETGRKVDL